MFFVLWLVKSEKYFKVCVFLYIVIFLLMEVKLKIYFGCLKVFFVLLLRIEMMMKILFLFN